MTKLTKEQIIDAVNAKAQEYNAIIQDGEGSIQSLQKLDEETKELVNEYTTMAMTECFNVLLSTADPMLEAVKMVYFDSIQILDSVDEESKVVVRTIEPAQKRIDLLRLHKKGKGIGQEKNWAYMIEKFNLLMTIKAADELNIKGLNIPDSYAMSDISKSIDMGKTPTSKTSLLRALQAIVTAMIGDEYKVLSHDVNYLLQVYTKPSNKKSLTVTCSNHRYMRQYIADICHRLATDGEYDINYKKAK